MITKKYARDFILEKRKNLDDLYIQNNSYIIFNKLIQQQLFKTSNTIYIYLPINNEVLTKDIIEYSWENRKKVAIPIIKEDSLSFIYINDFNSLKKGKFNILEPTTTNFARDINPLVIMPGISFDNKRNRVGYGKGYYDRFLANNSIQNVISIAYDFQVLNEEIEHEKYDIKPKYIITEKNIYIDNP